MNTFGHDSEFPLLLGGNVVSALDYLTPFETVAGRGFPDNANAEIAINPVSDLPTFHAYTETLLKAIEDQGFTPLQEIVATYPDEARDNPLFYISGCDPDFSAYTHAENTPPDFTDNTLMERSCGAHLHIATEADPHELAQWLDVYLGLPTFLQEASNTRRSMYGKAGCLRLKPYGVEYRTMSNVWLFQRERRDFIWEGAHKAIEAQKKWGDVTSLKDWTNIPTAIDTDDRTLGQQTLDSLSYIGVTPCP